MRFTVYYSSTSTKLLTLLQNWWAGAGTWGECMQAPISCQDAIPRIQPGHVYTMASPSPLLTFNLWTVHGGQGPAVKPGFDLTSSEVAVVADYAYIRPRGFLCVRHLHRKPPLRGRKA
jgi:hypothetical protein